MSDSSQIALEPRQFEQYASAILESGGEIAPLGPEVQALVWTDYAAVDELKLALSKNPQLRWV